MAAENVLHRNHSSGTFVLICYFLSQGPESYFYVRTRYQEQVIVKDFFEPSLTDLPGNKINMLPVVHV